MRAGAPAVRSSCGFTLVELVVSIVLSAIVAGFIVLFLDTPVQAYFQQTRRADLTDSAGRIASAVTADVRTALPNSLRTAVVGNEVALEFLQTEGTARYYGAGENLSAAEDLTTGASVSRFGTVDAFDSTATSSYSAPYLAVGNLGPGTANDAYATGSGVMTSNVTIVVPPPLPLVTGESQVNLSAPMTFAADGISTHNAYLVSGPVSYVCDTSAAAGTLTRYTGYAITSAQAVPPAAATAALIAHDVTACSFSYVRDPSYRFGEIAILNVTLSSGGESLRLFLEAPTEYSQ